MSDWAPKRFWTMAEVVTRDGGFAVDLDGRPVKTPYKTPLVMPTRALAEAVASEWQAQVELIDPQTMPVTRAANSAIDKVMPQRAEVAAMLAVYAETDLLCYRATAPEALIAQQDAAWNPWLSWAAQALDAPLHVTAGIMPIEQPAESLQRLHDRVAAFDAWELTGFHDLVQLSGSLVLALAVAAGKLTPDEAWTLSRIDEDFQISQWGDDEEATHVAEIKAQAFSDGARFMVMARSV
ncbi:Chaperone required for the assembly of the F1-ATPase [Loktanella sp. DSM 29012]|uniref:ATP12 family chaperone protein n=1 Tax=Loktanella sp. DSM 29012 TaxID=1881056 RepID=UPI0008CB8085|nr:ATP12 family protein [Loktanella sp. DSM 29012]SEQ37082.1 Chaperone required for the assembly of the F1-ATPase [Loktanella sp. DSM 29012]